jgi:hypothetical protein
MVLALGSSFPFAVAGPDSSTAAVSERDPGGVACRIHPGSDRLKIIYRRYDT